MLTEAKWIPAVAWDNIGEGYEIKLSNIVG